MTQKQPRPDLRRRIPLSIEEICCWAHAHRTRTGRWPTKDSGDVLDCIAMSWSRIDTALRAGMRRLPGGSSLAQLLAERFHVRNNKALEPLTIAKILGWADEYFALTGKWPSAKSGFIESARGENWSAVSGALRAGVRGLDGGSSLARLLAQHRGVRNRKGLPAVSTIAILRWADAHHERSGSWPNSKSGPIPESPGETWMAVEMALSHGQRGLPGGSSLIWLLTQERSASEYYTRTQLDVPTILRWADAYFERTGQWPTSKTELIAESQGDTWAGVDSALKKGLRSLTGGHSLAQLLEKERGVRNHMRLPTLSRKQILAWADMHRRRSGDWPSATSGPVVDAPDEHWAALNAVLKQGNRGLRPGGSLAQLLGAHRNRLSFQHQPPLSKKKILKWADEHFARTGMWPNRNTGQVTIAPREHWDRIDNALRKGLRGLQGETSLLRLLVVKRGVRNPLDLPALTTQQILQWAKAYRQQTGRWPHARSGEVKESAGDTWSTLNDALVRGKRSLTGGMTLSQLIHDNGT